jgi:hypothetical protein
LAVGDGFADGQVGDMGRAELQADHRERLGAWLGEDLGQKDLAEVGDGDDVVLGIGTGELGLDLFHEGTNGHLTVFADGAYFPGFLVGSKRIDESGMSPVIDEDFVTKLDFDVLAVDDQAFKTAVVGGDMPFGIVRRVDGSEAANDKAGFDAIENVQAINDRRSVRNKVAVAMLLAGNMRVRALEVDEILEMKIRSFGGGMPADGGKRGGRLRGHDRPERMLKEAAQSLGVGVKMKRNAVVGLGHRGQYLDKGF